MSVRFGPARARRIMAGSVTSSGGGGGTNPPPILTNLSAYWDVVDSTISQADAAGRARSISDLSGNGKTLQQLTAENQPTVASAGTAAGYLGYDGISQFMTASVASTMPFTAYFVGSQETWANGFLLWANAAASTGLGRIGTTPTVGLYPSGSPQRSTWPVATPAIITTVFNGASSAIRRNSDAAATADCGAANLTDMYVGGQNTAWSNMRMKALLVYGGIAHNTTQQNQIITWATAKWSIV